MDLSPVDPSSSSIGIPFMYSTTSKVHRACEVGGRVYTWVPCAACVQESSFRTSLRTPRDAHHHPPPTPPYLEAEARHELRGADLLQPHAVRPRQDDFVRDEARHHVAQVRVVRQHRPHLAGLGGVAR
jgi:hypothetical protein